MILRTNLFGIVVSHARTFRDLRTGKPRVKDYLFFYALPIVLGVVLVLYVPEKLLVKQIDRLLTAVSIIGGFLFALFAYVVTIIDRLDFENIKDPIKRRFAREIHANIAYGILVSLGCIVLLICAGFLFGDEIQASIDIRRGLMVALYFSISHFLLTLLLIVSRVFIVVSSKVR